MIGTIKDAVRIQYRSTVGWANVFLLATNLYQLPRGQTIKPFAHPTRFKDNTQPMATALPLFSRQRKRPLNQHDAAFPLISAAKSVSSSSGS